MAKGGGGETTQATEPWGGVQPHLLDLYGRVGGTTRTRTVQRPRGGGAAGRGAPGAGGVPSAQPSRAMSQIRSEMSRLEPGSPGWNRLQNELHSAAFEPDPAGGVRARGSGTTTVTEDVPGLIDQPLLIHDPRRFTIPEREAQQRMLQVGRAPTPELFGQASDVVGQTMGGEFLTPEGLLGEAAPEVMQTIGGEYLGANPHLDAMFEASARPVRESFMEETLPALTSQFAGAGRQGSGAHESVATGATEDLNRALADASANLYGGAYESERNRMLQAANMYGGAHAGERGRMMQALGMAPEIAGAPAQFETMQAGLLGDVGMARREMQEAFRAAEEARSREPWERLQMAAQLYGSGSPFTQTSQPFHRNRLAGGLGGAASGAAIGSMISPGMGTGIGAGIGGLMGMF